LDTEAFTDQKRYSTNHGRLASRLYFSLDIFIERK
jgi:hypothetical protein